MTLVKRLKRVFGGGPAIPEAAAPWAEHERVFHAPPLTGELVAAIKLIAPNCRDYRPTEKYRALWEQYQNAASWAEYQALRPVLDPLPKPRRILEIGPGLGRSLVFFTKKLGWQDAEIHAFDGSGTTTKYTKLGPRFEDSFCGNLRLLDSVLRYNGLEHVVIHDANEGSLSALPGPFDFLYSFYSIGFHWSLEHFLDDLMRLLDEKGTAVFTIPPSFELPQQLAGVYWERVPLYPNASKANRRDELFLVRKKPFPEVLRPAV
jgi:SAM-dependent methyltransferase